MAHRLRLLQRTQITGIKGIHRQVKTLPMAGDGFHFPGQVVKRITGKAAGVRGQNGGGQHTALDSGR